jgi:DNA polymerase III subunit delta
MAVVPEAQLDVFLKRHSAKLCGVLVHGSDEAVVAALVRTTIASLDKSAGASSTVLRIEAAALKAAPSMLLNEVSTKSLLGDRIVVIVSGCTDTALAPVRRVTEADATGNVIILEAYALPKSSKLRELCEQAENFASVSLYEDTPSSLKAHTDTSLKRHGLVWEEAAEDRFFDRVGSNRAAVLGELEKLTLYCLGAVRVTASDVDAVCGDSAEFTTDELLDSVMSGDMLATERILVSLDRGSSQTSSVLLQLLFHLQKLQGLRLDMATGSSVDTAIARARPPVFFKRKPAIVKQLRLFDLDILEELVLAVSSAILETRKRSMLAESVVSRTLFSIASRARSI